VKVSFNSTGVRPQVSKPPPKPLLPSLKRSPATPGTGGLAAPAPPKPTLQQVPGIAQSGAPVTMASTSDRISAREGYGQGLNSINRALMQAAMAYGGVNSVQQFGYDPSGGDTSSALGVTINPGDNSALSVIARNAAAQNKNIDETAGAENTFFSTRRLGDLQNVNSDADRQRAAAKAEYEANIADYLNQLTGLRSSRDESFRNADIADIEAARQNEPINQIPSMGPSVPSPGTAAAVKAAKPKPGFQYVQSEGSRAGQSYSLFQKNGKWYRRYENGDTVAR
jgi:hypothetical protein